MEDGLMVAAREMCNHTPVHQSRTNWLDEVERHLPVALPHAHFMAMAPLDVWARLLLAPPTFITPRYWLRLAAGLFTSSIGTAITLPERVLLEPYLATRLGRTDATIHTGPDGAIVVLGYFRTGTTHLHYLLNCDPRFVTPTWTQVTAPHGFWVSWAFFRLFLIPFLTEKRPQDDVAYGPDWPGEDDFALNNMSLASSLPGRLVLPRSRHQNDQRFHFLEGLSERELARWKRALARFIWKVRFGAVERALLLKTPSHTAHVSVLRSMFGPGKVKFVHISRKPEEVVRSNVAMLKRLSIYHLEDPPTDAQMEQRIVDEYERTQRAYLDASQSLTDSEIVEIRYEDLRSDPIGQLRYVYEALNIEWTTQFEARVVHYLHSVSGYEPAVQTDEQIETRPELRFIDQTFGHDAPPIEQRALPDAPQQSAHREEHRWWVTALWLIGLAGVLGLGWHAIVRLTLNRHDTFVWLVGAMVGAFGLRLARKGSARLGWACAVLTLVVAMAVAVPNTRYAYYLRHDPHRAHVTWDDLWNTTRREWSAGITLFWIGMGMVTAYRLASRGAIRPPGTMPK